MDKVDFSVLMSVYRKEKPDFLRVALDSIVNQSLVPTEIVLVKDGPLCDELNNVIAEYMQKYHFLKVLQLKKNVGLGKSLNEGMRHCTNNIVARMDTDDYSEKDRFLRQIDVLMNNPELDIVGSNICEYDEKLEKAISVRKVPENDPEIKKLLKTRNPVNHMSAMYRKDKVLEAGGYVDCPFFEDYYLWCRMAKNGCKFFNIQDSLVKVRAGQAMVNRRGGLLYAKNSINFEKKILRLKTINIFGFIFNSSIRVAVALSPNSLRGAIYSRGLRNGEK